ncbi:MAG: hypothetical protein QOJ26_1863 [Thermoplasmata archaeon]|nr:hypothetical protein [Thermoplasmata archaeon]
MAVRATVLAMAALAAFAIIAPAEAHPESAAPSLRADVIAVGHSPAVVPPHTQWSGFLQLSADSDVTAAYYQVCRVGDACFAPPTLATKVGDRFEFDTNDYLANGRPVDYEPGWRLGVTWVLQEPAANGTMMSTRFPEGPDLASQACQGDAASSCAEQHYFVFDIPVEEKPAPSIPVLWSVATLTLLAAILRRR